MVEFTSNDIVLMIGAIAGAICSIIAAVRLSRCEYVSLCKGLVTIKRTILKNTKKENNDNNDMNRTPSIETIKDDSAELNV
jgi:hypothetical protein